VVQRQSLPTSRVNNNDTKQTNKQTNNKQPNIPHDNRPDSSAAAHRYRCRQQTALRRRSMAPTAPLSTNRCRPPLRTRSPLHPPRSNHHQTTTTTSITHKQSNKQTNKQTLSAGTCKTNSSTLSSEKAPLHCCCALRRQRTSFASPFGQCHGTLAPAATNTPI
jgi:hypothetical protein